MRIAKFFSIFMLIGTLSLIGACAKSSAIEVGEAAPNFSLNDMDGKAVSLSDFKGKVIILNFFATWCPPCRGEIPDFIELQKSYGSKGLSIIGVSTEEIGTLKDFAGKNGMNYPVLVDFAGKANAVYGPIRAVPTTFVIDKEFRVRQHYIGARPKEVFENDIKELLK